MSVRSIKPFFPASEKRWAWPALGVSGSPTTNRDQTLLGNMGELTYETEYDDLECSDCKDSIGANLDTVVDSITGGVYVPPDDPCYRRHVQHICQYQRQTPHSWKWEFVQAYVQGSPDQWVPPGTWVLSDQNNSENSEYGAAAAIYYGEIDVPSAFECDSNRFSKPVVPHGTHEDYEASQNRLSEFLVQYDPWEKNGEHAAYDYENCSCKCPREVPAYGCIDAAVLSIQVGAPQGGCYTVNYPGTTIPWFEECTNFCHGASPNDGITDYPSGSTLEFEVPATSSDGYFNDWAYLPDISCVGLGGGWANIISKAFFFWKPCGNGDHKNILYTYLGQKVTGASNEDIASNFLFGGNAISGDFGGQGESTFYEIYHEDSDDWYKNQTEWDSDLPSGMPDLPAYAAGDMNPYQEAGDAVTTEATFP